MPITEAQRKERVNYIGATDAAAVLGLSRWTTPLQVWAEKTGLLEPEDISDKLPVKLGNKMEHIVVELFEEETGKKCHRVNETRYHPKHAFLAANIDRRVVGEEAILECKTTSAWKAKEWEGEEIPREYLIQVYAQLMVTGAAYAYLAVLIGNQSFIWKRIERDPELMRDMEAKLVDFWTTYVVPKVRPSVIMGSDQDTLYRLYPKEKAGTSVALGDDIVRLIESRSALLTDKAAISKQIDSIDAEIKAALGDHEIGMAGKYKITWKAFERKEYTVKASQGRTLRIKENTNGNGE